MKKVAKKTVKKTSSSDKPVKKPAIDKKAVAEKATKNISSNHSLLQLLNAEQQQAASHTGGPLLIIAGAGTGKTTTLVHRVAWLIEQGVPPAGILLLTFTRRAAFEMYHRVETVLQQQNQKQSATQRQGIWHGTFHAVATRFLRMYGLAIDLPRDFTILDRGDSEDLIASIRVEMGLDKAALKFPKKGTCMTIYSLHVNSRVPVDKLVLERFRWLKGHVKDEDFVQKHLLLQNEQKNNRQTTNSFAGNGEPSYIRNASSSQPRTLGPPSKG